MNLFLVKSTTKNSTVRYDLIPHLLRQSDEKNLLICDGISLMTSFCAGIKGQHAILVVFHLSAFVCVH